MRPTSIWSRSLGVVSAALVLLISAGPAGADERCYALRDQREAIAAAAMKEEITLARRYRERLCPSLNRQAEAANANTMVDAEQNTSHGIIHTIDYQALINCRNRAEHQLEKEQKIIDRNRLGFTFYTTKGAGLARQADASAESMAEHGCQP